ncbi:hypothetical protein RIR_jg8574.t1 [Rhizophagus irregularis DAOM 181602=DAOM 197198]|nr:hypothetical protein RIR_jg8574.t1 [Rhizophagus irregularis DAOM 181602=DAOM 197198]
MCCDNRLSEKQWIFDVLTTEIMETRKRKWSSTSESEMNAGRNYDPDFGRKVPDVWMKRTGSGRLKLEMNRNDTNKSKRTDSGRLDNELRNEPVPDVRMNETTGSGHVRMNETTGSGRLDNGNQNEPVFTSFYFGIGDT